MNKLIFSVASVLLFCLSGFSYADHPIWYAPDQRAWAGSYSATLDYNKLFTNESLWVNARPYVDVFKFYGYSITAGPNAFTDPQVQLMVTKLNSWGISIALELEPIRTNPYCTGAKNAPEALAVMDRLAAFGGTTRYIDMDEAYYHGSKSVYGCSYSMATSADETAFFINLIHAKYPGVVVGDIEPYPYFSVATLESWIATFRTRAGYEFPFFHLDVDRNARGWNINDVKTLKNYCSGRGIEFGVIFNDNVQPFATSDQGFYQRTMDWGSVVNSGMGMPQDIILQSWNDKPDYNLPDSSGYSFTQLLKDFMHTYVVSGNGNNAQFISQNVPTAMEAGNYYTVSVLFNNNGITKWSTSTYYNLGSQNPSDNTVWGLNRVSVGDPVNVGQTKNFTFQIKAPTTPGNYSFKWRMVKDGLEWFGPNTTNVQVSVTGGPPIGNLDYTGCDAFMGWSCDPSNYSQPVSVHFYADGTAGTGQFLGAASANQPRESAVGGMCGGYSSHGFAFPTPASLKDGRNHTIYAYGINIPSGSNPLLSNTPLSIRCTTTTSTTTTTTTTTTTSTTTSSTSTTSTTTSTIPTTTTTSTTTMTTTTSTTITLEICVMPGNYPPCGLISLNEVVDSINRWVGRNIELGDVIDLIDSWTDPITHPPA